VIPNNPDQIFRKSVPRIALDVPPMLLARAGLLQRMSLEMADYVEKVSAQLGPPTTSAFTAL